MLQDKLIAAVIPVFNEERFIEGVLAGLPAYIDHVIVVNDGSCDTTGRRLAASMRPGLCVLEHRVRGGVGRALATGFRCALECGADVIVTLDGDGQMDPQDIRSLLEPVLSGRADWSKGDRLSLKESRREMPWTRYWGNLVFSSIQSWALGAKVVRDSQSGFTAIRSDVLRRIDIDTLWPRFGIYNDLLGRLVAVGSRIENVPVKALYGPKRSHMKFREVLGILRLLWIQKIKRPSRGPAKKILVLTSSFPRSDEDAAGRFVLEFCESLVERGDEVTVLAPHAPGAQPLLTSRVKIKRFRYFWPWRFQTLAYGDGMPENLSRSFWGRVQVPFYMAASFCAAFREALRADVIYAHWLVPSGLVAIGIKVLLGKKVIMTAHSTDISFLSGAWSFLLRILVSLADKVTVVSRKGLSEILERIPEAEHSKISLLPMGISNPSFFSQIQGGSSETCLRGSAIEVLYMGRLVKIKGVDLLLEALSGMENVRLTLSGEGSAKKELVSLSQALGVQSVFTGALVGSRKEEVLRNADIVVVPSRVETGNRTEGLPVVLLEAMAYGKAIVASSSGGMVDVIRDGENGFLFSPGDSNDLKCVLTRLAADAGLRKRISERARATAERFQWPRVIPAYRALASCS